MTISPLPSRNGINPTKLRLPPNMGYTTIFEYVLSRFNHISRENLISRFNRGDIFGDDGSVITISSSYSSQNAIWYYRELPVEKEIPFEINIIYQDSQLLVVDKPHFLPTTPSGRYLQQSALVRLRNKLNIIELTPIHRLDRMTAGVLLLSVNPETRGAYQSLFEKRQVHKIYEAICRPSMNMEFPHIVRNRLVKSRDFLLTQVLSGEANSETHILSEENLGKFSRYTLNPITGKTHQLRIHMSSLGLGIINDTFYPILLEDVPDNYSKPLQLLAKQISFRDPLSNKDVIYKSSRKLLF